MLVELPSNIVGELAAGVTIPEHRARMLLGVNVASAERGLIRRVV